MQGWPRPLPLSEDCHLMPALRSAALRHFALGPATAPFLIGPATKVLRRSPRATTIVVAIVVDTDVDWWCVGRW